MSTREGLLSKARAGPSGVLRPCSQFGSVDTFTPIIKENCDWDNPNRSRIARMSTGRNSKTPARHRLTPANLARLFDALHQLGETGLPHLNSS
jgi:hypothetical protein